MDEPLSQELFGGMMKIIGMYTGIGMSKSGRPEMRFELTTDGAVSEATELSQGEYMLDIKKPRNKRSLSQNALMWELIGQIDIRENGKRTPEDDEQIYMNILKEAGVKYYSIEVEKAAYERFKELTSDTFRAYEVAREYSNWYTGDMLLVHCFIGSSKLDTKQMSTVIDTVISYAENVGIDTAYWNLQLRGIQ